MNGRRRVQSTGGFTLVELVVAIVILGVALAGILGVMTLTTGHSADPMIQRQAIAVAEAYMEEILLRPFADPDGVGGESRANFDDVFDYHNLGPQAPQNQEGAAIAELTPYQVSVQVTNDTLNTVPAARIAVRVQHPGGVDFTLTGYRLNW
ncbi:MAG: prepilin-type N-terminal cleavage/methylation domain-containing protein [Desulfuromonadales bacterium]|nr:prepilin-type N-terminal cleavage/methylation domain-containing protein [Desulfuromonadales bacterium]